MADQLQRLYMVPVRSVRDTTFEYDGRPVRFRAGTQFLVLRELDPSHWIVIERRFYRTPSTRLRGPRPTVLFTCCSAGPTGVDQAPLPGTIGHVEDSRDIHPLNGRGERATLLPQYHPLVFVDYAPDNSAILCDGITYVANPTDLQLEAGSGVPGMTTGHPDLASWLDVRGRVMSVSGRVVLSEVGSVWAAEDAHGLLVSGPSANGVLQTLARFTDLSLHGGVYLRTVAGLRPIQQPRTSDGPAVPSTLAPWHMPPADFRDLGLRR